jgi:hypothetical protein
MNFLTFGFPISNQEKYKDIAGAAKRLLDQARDSKFFDQCHSASIEDVPRIASFIGLEELPSSPHMHWYKTLFVYAMFQGFYGEPSDFLYLDAGSEIQANWVSRFDFLAIRKCTENFGLYVEQTRYKERSWNKDELLEYFGKDEEKEVSGQIASGLLGISTAPKFSRQNHHLLWEWLRISSLNDCLFLRDATLTSHNRIDFMAHRHDQSVLSLLCKFENRRLFPEKQRTFSDRLFQIRGSSTAFLHSRNRTSKSRIPKAKPFLLPFALLMKPLLDALWIIRWKLNKLPHYAGMGKITLWQNYEMPWRR